jgi:hypothetical protein
MTRALLAALLLLPLSARAAFHINSEADLGALVFLGGAGDNAAPGPTLGARLGYAPTSWLSLGFVASGSTHEATVPPPPSGELFQLYLLGADVRFSVRAGRIGLFLEGSGGVAIFSTNVLDSVGVTEPGRSLGAYLAGGGGLQYHIANPRFAFGLAGDYTVLPDLGFVSAVAVRVYLRYSR